MRRKEFETDEMEGLNDWFALQNFKTLDETNFNKFRAIEKKWVKEGVCEECGAFDILSKFRNSFICSLCFHNLNNNHKNDKNRKNIKRRKK